MGKEILTFGDIEIEKNKITVKRLFFFKEGDIDEVLVSKNISVGE